MSGATIWLTRAGAQIGGDALVKEFRRDLLELMPVVARGIVHQNRDRPECCTNAIDCRPCRSDVAQIDEFEMHRLTAA